MCLFELDYSRDGGHEYYVSLPEKASARGCESTTKGHRAGMCFFERRNVLPLVFHDCDTAPRQIHHIGDFEDGSPLPWRKRAGVSVSSANRNKEIENDKYLDGFLFPEG